MRGDLRSRCFLSLCAGTAFMVATTALAQSELMVNGGFESGDLAWVRAAYGTNQINGWWNNSDSGAHSGSHCQCLTGDSVDELIYQTVTIPSVGASATLSYYLVMSTSELSYVGARDKLKVEIRNASGVLLSTPVTYSNMDAYRFGYWHQETLDISQYAGLMIQIGFRGTTDGDTRTLFCIDDVSARADVPVSTTSTTTQSTTTSSTTTASTTTTTIAATTVQFNVGWNLVGNSTSGTLNVASSFADVNNVNTVWTWVAQTARWAFYAPSLVGQQLSDYAASKDYDVLVTVNPGEGFWVNAKSAFTAQAQAGTPIASTSFRSNLVTGWNLIAVGDNPTPSEFNRTLSLTTPASGEIPLNVITLWAWDAGSSNWYLYAPSLEKNGTLASYIASKSYLDFGTNTLGPTTGFWVNVPASGMDTTSSTTTTTTTSTGATTTTTTNATTTTSAAS